MTDLLFQVYVGWIMFGPILCLYGVLRLWSLWRVEQARSAALEKRCEALEERVNRLESANGDPSPGKGFDA